MNTKNNKRSKVSIKRIQITLLNELKEKPLNKIKIKTLCDIAHINRTTFYSHYDTVEDVLYDICEDQIFEVYKVFQNKNIEYKQKLKNGIKIIGENIEKFKYFFKYVPNIEQRIINVVELRSTNNINNIKKLNTLLSLTFVISGFVGVGKMYISQIEQNPRQKLNLDEITDMIYNSINLNNPYFYFE